MMMIYMTLVINASVDDRENDMHLFFSWASPLEDQS
jgi:hypothetical protein